MDKQITFNPAQLKELGDAVLIAEELVSNHYKMSSTQWLRSRYDIKTFIELQGDEIVDGPFAQVLGYNVRKKDGALGSGITDYYTVCLQDSTILERIAQNQELILLPFLVYITVHELVHIVRFSKFEQMYSASSESQCAMEEERKVHSITAAILNRVAIAGMDKVLTYYKKWL
ncbi:MAG: hypothetical protein HQK73_06570 [Desulfamplus sp.]|nr:hypothetical protein [Desulfamplus sp.]MBF0413177.1 hypothetical protein [Desulfamplus sp.]